MRSVSSSHRDLRSVFVCVSPQNMVNCGDESGTDQLGLGSL